MERSVLQGLAAFRWGAWVWMATVLTASRDDLGRPWLAVALIDARRRLVDVLAERYT